MPLVIRDAALDDVPAILQLEQAASSAAHWTAELYKSRIGDGFMIVAELEGALCGFLCARLVAGECEVENVVVGQKFRRCGIAKELLRTLIAKWDNAAGTAVLLEVRESNTAARALYERCGFREVGHRRRYYRGPIEDAILYAYHRPR